MTTTEQIQQHLQTCDLRRTRADTVAAALKISNTTMRRRLRGEGVQYYTLVEAERLRRCEQLLQDKPTMRGKEMMEELGCTELNSFFRAFRRWTGLNFRDKHNPAPVKLCEWWGWEGGCMTVTAFPLCWPAGWPRTRFPEWSRFKVTPAKARADMLKEIEKLGGRDIIISTDVPLRRDGNPDLSRRPPEDQGVAVYFTYNKRPMVFACDKWGSIPENFRSIGKTIEALRGIERWGASDMMERAFTGFTALPDKTNGSWWAVLGVAPDASREDVTAAYNRQRSACHPDKPGGSHDAFVAVTEAWSQYQAVQG